MWVTANRADGSLVESGLTDATGRISFSNPGARDRRIDSVTVGLHAWKLGAAAGIPRLQTYWGVKPGASLRFIEGARQGLTTNFTVDLRNMPAPPAGATRRVVVMAGLCTFRQYNVPVTALYNFAVEPACVRVGVEGQLFIDAHVVVEDSGGAVLGQAAAEDLAVESGTTSVSLTVWNTPAAAKTLSSSNAPESLRQPGNTISIVRRDAVRVLPYSFFGLLSEWSVLGTNALLVSGSSLSHASSTSILDEFQASLANSGNYERNVWAARLQPLAARGDAASLSLDQLWSPGFTAPITVTRASAFAVEWTDNLSASSVGQQFRGAMFIGTWYSPAGQVVRAWDAAGARPADGKRSALVMPELPAMMRTQFAPTSTEVFNRKDVALASVHPSAAWTVGDEQASVEWLLHSQIVGAREALRMLGQQGGVRSVQVTMGNLSGQ